MNAGGCYTHSLFQEASLEWITAAEWERAEQHLMENGVVSQSEDTRPVHIVFLCSFINFIQS